MPTRHNLLFALAASACAILTAHPASAGITDGATIDQGYKILDKLENHQVQWRNLTPVQQLEAQAAERDRSNRQGPGGAPPESRDRQCEIARRSEQEAADYLMAAAHRLSACADNRGPASLCLDELDAAQHAAYDHQHAATNFAKSCAP